MEDGPSSPIPKSWAFRAAIGRAQKSRFPKYSHGAVIERGGRIVSTGINVLKPKNPQPYRSSIHAEMMALKNAGPIAARGGTLYVVRLTHGKKLAMSKPCPMCDAAIREAGIKRVIYSIGETIDEFGTINIRH